MSESARDLLVRGVAAAKAGEEKEARFFLEWMLDLGGDLDQKIHAWYWLSKVTGDIKLKRNYLENILANQPFHLLARREIMILDGKLDLEEIIDPNKIPLVGGDRDMDIGIRSFTCPNCGGRMVYTPDGSSLTCEYCDARKSSEFDHRGANLADTDFLLSMATSRGHSQPSQTQAIECNACGIQFVLPPATLSFTCPHCTTAYVVNENNIKQTITPGGIVPARVSKEAALAIIRRWTVENNKPDVIKDITIKGMYLPIWWFSFGGQINFNYYIEKDNNRRRSQPEMIRDIQPVLRTDIMVPAETDYEDELTWQISMVNADLITAYKPDYLSNWAAETYQVSVAEASLRARQIAFDLEKKNIKYMLPSNAGNPSYDSHQLMIDTYKLVLLPAWIGEIKILNGRIPFYLNAENGKLKVNQGLGAEKSWWKTLFSYD